MILTLIKLGIEFDNIREQILTGPHIPTFDDILVWLLRYSSITTRSRHSVASLDTSVMLAPFNPRGDSGSIRGGHRVEASDLIVPIVIDRVTFETGVISYTSASHCSCSPIFLTASTSIRGSTSASISGSDSYAW